MPTFHLIHVLEELICAVGAGGGCPPGHGEIASSTAVRDPVGGPKGRGAPGGDTTGRSGLRGESSSIINLYKTNIVTH